MKKIIRLFSLKLSHKMSVKFDNRVDCLRHIFTSSTFKDAEYEFKDCEVIVEDGCVETDKGLTYDEAMALADLDEVIDLFFLNPKFNKKNLLNLTEEQVKELIEIGIINSQNVDLPPRSFYEFCILYKVEFFPLIFPLMKEPKYTMEMAYMFDLSELKTKRTKCILKKAANFFTSRNLKK